MCFLYLLFRQSIFSSVKKRSLHELQLPSGATPQTIAPLTLPVAATPQTLLSLSLPVANTPQTITPLTLPVDTIPESITPFPATSTLASLQICSEDKSITDTDKHITRDIHTTDTLANTYRDNDTQELEESSRMSSHETLKGSFIRLRTLSHRYSFV